MTRTTIRISPKRAIEAEPQRQTVVIENAASPGVVLWMGEQDAGWRSAYLTPAQARRLGAALVKLGTKTEAPR